MIALGEMQHRSLWSDVQAEEWDGIIPLTDLFNTEHIPSDQEAYIDQRFLDYLSVNLNNLEKIHWRNFERICAEFFNRANYKVQLGPGTSDGGIDIRIWPKDKEVGPPLILIQCKRYKQNNLVTVEYVKALWADLIFENAQKGIIATTSHITPGGKKICEVRKWPLTFAENEQVSKWVYSMWRHAWSGKGNTTGIGKYLIPPFLPLNFNIEKFKSDKKITKSKA